MLICQKFGIAVENGYKRRIRLAANHGHERFDLHAPTWNAKEKQAKGGSEEVSIFQIPLRHLNQRLDDGSVTGIRAWMADAMFLSS